MPSCKVCLEEYTLGGRRPLLLPCGHTFCRQCLILVQSSPCTGCPMCRASLVGVVLHDLPVNYDLLAYEDDYFAPNTTSLVDDMVKRSLMLGASSRNTGTASAIMSSQGNKWSDSQTCIGLKNQRVAHWRADQSHTIHRTNPGRSDQSHYHRVNPGRSDQSHYHRVSPGRADQGHNIQREIIIRNYQSRPSHHVPKRLPDSDTNINSLVDPQQQSTSKQLPPELPTTTYTMKGSGKRSEDKEDDNVFFAASGDLGLSAASGDLGLSAASGDLGLSAASGDLGLSAARGDLDVVKELIRRGADVNSDKHEVHGRRVLHLAAEAGHKAVVEALLRAGAHVDACDHQGFTALHLASWAGHSRVVNLLLRYKADGEILAQGKGAFHWAALGGHVSVLQELDRHQRFNRRSQTSDHKTALHLAADNGNLEAVQWLVAHGVGLNIKDEAGHTAEDYARDEGHFNIASYLCRQVLLQQVKLLESAAEGVLLVVKELVNSLVGVECRSQQEGQMGRRPLQVAAENGHIDVVQVLLDAGANPDTPDDQGNTAMHYAASGGQVEVLDLLKEKGANCFVRNQDNQTPLHSAGAAGKLEAMIWLLEQGVSPFLATCAGDTHEDLARKNGHENIVAVLRHYYC